MTSTLTSVRLALAFCALGACAPAVSTGAGGHTQYGSGAAPIVAAPGPSTFQDLSGRFTVDLPGGYKQEEQEASNLFRFVGDGPTLLFLFDSGETETTKSFQSMVKMVGSALSNLTPERPERDFIVNGKPGRSAVYTGLGEASGRQAEMRATIATVVLGKGTLTLFAVAGPKDDRSRWDLELQSLIESIRNVGDPVTGVGPASALVR